MPDTITAEPLSVTLTMDSSMRDTLARDERALASAQAYVIDCPEMAVEANNELKAIKARIETVKKLRDGFVQPAKQILENARALFDPALRALEQGENHLKGVLITWTQAERKRLDEEQRKRDEAQRVEQARIAAANAEAIAKAEQLAQGKREEAEAAAARQREALESGDIKGAAKAAGEAAKLAEQATNITEGAFVRAQAAVVTAHAAVPAVAHAMKVDGFSVRDNYVAELALNTTETVAIEKIAAQIAAGRRDLVSLLRLDMGAASKMAKVQKELFAIPGLVAVNRPVAASRRA